MQKCTVTIISGTNRRQQQHKQLTFNARRGYHVIIGINHESVARCVRLCCG